MTTLTRELQALKREALSGSLSATSELMRIGDTLSDQQMLRIVCPVVLKHLEIGNIPAHPVIENLDTLLDKINLAVFSFGILTQAFTDRGSRECLVHLCRQNWVAFQSWLAFLIDIWPERGDFQSDTPENMGIWTRVLSGLAFFTGGFARHITRQSDSPRDLETLPHLAPMLMRIWLIASEENLNIALIGASQPLVELLSNLNGAKSPASRGQLALCLEDPRHNAVTIMFRSLKQQLLQGSQTFPSELDCIMTIISRSAHFSNHFYLLSVAAGSIPTIAAVMSCLTSHKQPVPQDAIEYEAVKSCLVSCAVYMQQCFDEGPTFTAEALRERVLISILKSTHYLTRSSTSDVPTHLQVEEHYVELLECTMSYLLYPSVLNEVIRSLKTSEVRGLVFGRKHSRLLRERWEELGYEAYRHKIWRSDVYMRSPANSLCSNEKCPRSLDRQYPIQDLKMMYCSRCRAVIYCSPQCQKSDWQQRHRKQCDVAVSRRHAGYRDPIPPHDFHYIKAAVHYAIVEAKSEIKGLISGHRDSNPSEVDPPVVEFSYSHRVRPYSLAVVSGRQNGVERSSFVEELWSKMVEEAKSTEGTIVLVTLPSGRSYAGKKEDPHSFSYFTIVQLGR